MKNMDIIEALDFIDTKYIEEANEENCTVNYKKASKIRTVPLKKRLIASVAAVLAIAILVTGIMVLGPNAPLVTKVEALSVAEYPIMTKYPGDYFATSNYDTLYAQWLRDVAKQEKYFGAGDNLDGFIKNSVTAFLSDLDGGNVAYSPLNIYMSMAMIAEISGGETRQQALNALNCPSVEELREQTHAIWNANYRNDGKVKSVLASSLWLSDKAEYNKAVTDILAEKYYTSVYRGRMDSAAYGEEYIRWMKEQTGNYNSDYINSLTPFTKDNLISIASTISYEARWEFLFPKSKMKTGEFHTADGSVSCTYLNKIEVYGSYYWGEQFTATSKALENSGSMYFILPNEGISVEQLMKNSELLDFIVSDGRWANKENTVVEITVPVFDVSSNMDLKDGFGKMGVTDCFDIKEADFSSITDKSSGGLCITDAEHGVRVSVNEEGCTGTAFTGLNGSGAANQNKPQKTFTAERPFIFVITGADGLPLFIGVVNQPAIA